VRARACAARRQGTHGLLNPARAPAAAIQGVYAQCGGITNAPSAAEAQNAPWPSSACEAGSTCTYGAPAALRPPLQQPFLPQRWRANAHMLPAQATRTTGSARPARSVRAAAPGVRHRDSRPQGLAGWPRRMRICRWASGPGLSMHAACTKRQMRAWRAGERLAASASAPRRCLPTMGAARVLGRVVTLPAGGANATSLAASYQSMAAVAPAAAPAAAEQGCMTQVQAGKQCGGRGMSCYGSQCQARARPARPPCGLRRRPAHRTRVAHQGFAT
jgi:hypothetical protein